ncbi:MAG: ABC transporter substrate-binding protein [Bacteroidales bacterium]|nr:ABC transporter substrate-binding protein [Bacteroidales bacterium]
MRFLFLLSILFFLWACQSNNKQLNNIVTNRYANHFLIKVLQDSSYILKVINPYQGSENDTFTYYLSAYSKPNSIHIPIQRAVLFSTTYIGYFEALNELKAIKAISGTSMVYNSKLRNEIEQNHILEVGYENNINFEQILSLHPDVVFIYSVGKENMPYVNKLLMLHIPVVYVAEFMEENPLGRAEWIKFFSVFFQKKQLADSIFEQIENCYKTIKNNIHLSHRPTVFFNIPYQEVWYMPNGNSYFAQLTKDAGGNYIFCNQQKAVILKFDFEKVLLHAQNADIWLNPGIYQSKKELLKADKRYELFKAFKTNAIYNHTKRITLQGGNDFWESGVVKPHLILEDLIHIFNNDSNFQFHYYQKVL